MRYCDAMYLSLKEAVSSQMIMGVPSEDIMQEEKLRRRFCVQGCGGQPFIRTQKCIAKCVICVKGLVGHRGGMRCL